MNNKEPRLDDEEQAYLDKTEFLSGAEISQSENLSDERKQELNEFVDSTLFGKRPRIIVNEKEKTILLACNDELWEVIMKMRKENKDGKTFSFDLMSVGRFYFQLKSIFEKMKGKGYE